MELQGILDKIADEGVDKAAKAAARKLDAQIKASEILASQLTRTTAAEGKAGEYGKQGAENTELAAMQEKRKKELAEYTDLVKTDADKQVKIDAFAEQQKREEAAETVEFKEKLHQKEIENEKELAGMW